MEFLDEIKLDESKFIKYKRFLFLKIKDKNFLKGISTVIGAAILNFVIGAIFSVCQLVLYEISYIRWTNPNNNITIDNQAFYYPTEKIAQHLASFISGILYKKLGLHYTNLIGIIILFFGYLTLFLSKRFAVDMISMVLTGIGTGIIYYPSTANACEWFIHNKGIIIGIIETMISLGSFFFDLLGERMVNKAQDKGEEDEKFYTLEEGEKFKTFMIYLIIIVIVFCIFAFLLMFVKRKDTDSDKNKIDAQLIAEVNDSDQNPININPEESIDNIILDENQPSEVILNEDSPKKNYSFKKKLKTVMKSKQLIIFALIVILEGPLTSTIFGFYQGIGKNFKISRKVLNSIGPVNFILECIAGFIFGLLCDYISNKNLLLFIFGVDIIVGYLYVVSFNYDALFFIFTNLASFTCGGFYSVKDYYLMTVFGVELYVIIIAYVNFLSAVVVIVLTPVVYALIKIGNKNLKPDEKPNTAGYWITFVLLSTCSLISLVFSLIVKYDPFDYEEHIEKKSDEKKQDLITENNNQDNNDEILM